ncbi:MAG: hypothetical protein QG604_423 [Candidatus Dependentiae bacterium]|nr:hypothetical protein [Candidatus Dependentiae bacterium]
MTQGMAKSAQSVQAALTKKGLSCTVVEMAASTRTAQDAATALGCEVAHIAKSLIFKTATTHRPVLVVASGPNRVDEKIIAFHVGEAIVKADAPFVREVTGFAIGGIPPIGHAQKIEHIFIDRDLLKFEMLWAAAGTPNAVFNIGTGDLVGMINGTIIAVY